MLNQNDKNIGTLVHLSAFLSFVFPFGSIIGPVIMWAISKNKSDYLDKNGIEAINFNLSYTLYILILGIMMFPFAIGSIFNFVRSMNDFEEFNNFNFSFDHLFGFVGLGSLIAIVTFFRFLLIIVAAIKANRGEVYDYPLSINFVKDKEVDD